MLRRDPRPVEASPGASHLPMSGLIRSRLRRLLLILATLLALQTIALSVLENLTLFEAFWLTMTTLLTVGYGDLAPATTLGRILTMSVMYIGSITILTLIVSDYIEYRFYRRERMIMGRWRYRMKNHIVIINTPLRCGDQYFKRLADQIRAVPGHEQAPIQLLTNHYPDGIPAELRDAGLVHFTGHGSDANALRNVNITQARHIIVIAPDETDPESDSLTFDIVHRLSEMNLANRVTVECVRDENRRRFTGLGVRTVIRPVRTYPEIMVRAVSSPGTEKVLEDLFDYEHDHPHRYDLPIADLQWADIVSALIRHGIGTALAYIDRDGQVVCHPNSTDDVDGTGLIVLVRSKDTPPTSEIEEALNRYRDFLDRWHNREEARESETP
ncbi:ion transporter [Tamilnaduibacter salinus]|uniref:Ion transporter n=1 Tax=Tamilnaduibacter salinus TaxID=1484056 RepID=A0A2A2I3K3_9GAMM|nr:ion channel [Tamilnaduibacter salinus]PAV25886.1 ion transporter [Tamilnaduibacter salinus]